MNISTLQEYIQKVKIIDRHYKRKGSKKEYAPYKPFLLLIVIELIEQGVLYKNKILLSDNLIETFNRFTTLTPTWNSEINNPFFHLQGKKNDNRFWHLHPVELSNSTTTPSVHRLRESGVHAYLDDRLFVLLAMPEYREIIRQTIINTHLPKLGEKIDNLIEKQRTIKKQEIEEESKEYSESLIKDTEHPFLSHREVESIQVETPIRSAGFRRAIMEIYNYTCAVCELNIRASTGESLTDAAHIIPFSVSYNDDIRNGISLCKSHHWAFDTGLISLNEEYHVIISSSIREQGPTQWMLTKLRDKLIRRPEDEEHYPAQDALAWHRERVLRQ